MRLYTINMISYWLRLGGIHSKTDAWHQQKSLIHVYINKMAFFIKSPDWRCRCSVVNVTPPVLSVSSVRFPHWRTLGSRASCGAVSWHYCRPLSSSRLCSSVSPSVTWEIHWRRRHLDSHWVWSAAWALSPGYTERCPRATACRLWLSYISTGNFAWLIKTRVTRY